MALDLTQMSDLLSKATIGIIPAYMVGILAVIMLAVLMYKGRDTQKTIQAIAPITFLMAIIGFQMNIFFSLLAAIMFIIVTIIGTEFKSVI